MRRVKTYIYLKRTGNRFPVELKRLLRYIEAKRQSAQEDINVTHVTMKACAVRKA